jgi:tRNA U54 and U55 pseudouridine synthase Pus10
MWLTEVLQGGQPYTILTEYRSLADIIMSMMVHPMYVGMEHLKEVRNLDQVRWKRRLDRSPYSGELKNFVYELMAKNDAEHLSSQNLYLRAKQGLLKFMNILPEGKEMIHVDTVRSQRAMVLQQEASEQRRETARLNDWFEKQEARARVRAKSPDRAPVGEQARLLADIFKLCEQAQKS